MMEGLKVYYRGVEVPEGLWRLEEVFEGRLDDWRQGVDSTLDGPEEAPNLAEAFAKPRVFHSAEDIPADVRKIELACGDIAHRVDDERWLFYLESDPADSWRIPPEDLPVTEVI